MIRYTIGPNTNNTQTYTTNVTCLARHQNAAQHPSHSAQHPSHHKREHRAGNIRINRKQITYIENASARAADPIFGLKIVSRGAGRYLKRFPRFVALSWLNMSPWRAMGTPFVSKMINFLCLWQAKTCAVLGDQTCTVLRDHTCAVLGDQTRAVLGDKTCAVSGDQTRAVYIII